MIRNLPDYTALTYLLWVDFMSAESDLGWFLTDPLFCFLSLKNLLQFWGSGRVTSFLQFFTEPEASWMPGFVCDEIWRYYTQGRKRFHAIWCNLVRFGAIRCDFMRFDFQKKRATQPRAAKQTGHTSYTHTGARGGGLQDYIHTQVPEVPCVCVWRPSSRNAMN